MLAEPICIGSQEPISAMFDISFLPQWTIRHPERGTLGSRVLELLVSVATHGSLSAACTSIGLSYRHAWQMLRDGEALFGQPLLSMSRGKGSELTPLGEKLVWAQRRVHARLAPSLDTLSSEVKAEINKALAPASALLRIHGSHGYAVQALHEFLLRGGIAHELRYCGSAEALSSLRNHQCDIAGVHVPVGDLESAAIEHYRPMLNITDQRLIRLATRRQGLIVAPGNPRKIYSVEDLARPDIRFINRQSGSGTRYLLDLMLQRRHVDPGMVRGYEQCEFTHAAVAAFVASGMADVGFGIEVPAREFKLEFIPCEQERYFLLCSERNIDSPELRMLTETLLSDDYRAAVNRLPGYCADESGSVVQLDHVFKSIKPVSKRTRWSKAACA